MLKEEELQSLKEKHTRHALQPYLPEDAMASFVSEVVTRQALPSSDVRALVLTPYSLTAVQLTWALQQEAPDVLWREDNATVHYLPSSEIRSVKGVYHASANVGADHFDSLPRACFVHIELSKQLPPFGKEIDLPLDQHAYKDDNTQTIHGKTLSFAKALETVVGRAFVSERVGP
jgi:hypothetical protein